MRDRPCAPFLLVNKKPSPDLSHLLGSAGLLGLVSEMESAPYAKLEGAHFDFLMTKKRVVIGRNSKQGHVDINMGSSRFISRRHLEIALDRNSFYILCRGKNGVFVDSDFHQKENKRLQIPLS